MLSSRYLHLHEALGLGPMWLNRGAKVLPAADAAARTAPPAEAPAPAAAPEAAEPPARRAPAHPPIVQTNKTARPSEKTQAAPAPTAPTLPHSLPVPVAAADVHSARLMVVAVCPAPEDGTAGRLFSGDAGILLDNMLAAIGLAPEDAHKTVWVKNAAVFTPEPSPEQMAEGLPPLQAELAASQARSVLFLGQIFEQPHHAAAIRDLCGNTPHFTIPHPARLLRQPHLKKQAWAVLKQLRQQLPDAG